MATPGSGIDSGYLLQTLSAYGDGTPAPVQAKIIDQASINAGRRIGQIALFYDNGDPFTVSTDVASLPAGTPPTPATDKVVAVQGGAAVLLTIQSLMSTANSLTLSTSGVATDGKAYIGVNGLTKGAMSVFYNSGDTNPTIMTSASLGILFGPGGASGLDTTLARSGVGALTLTGSLLSSGSANGISTYGTATSQGSVLLSSTVYGPLITLKGNTGDSQPKSIFSNESLAFGPGGSTAVDWTLRRVATGQANVEGHLGILDGKNIYFGQTNGTKIGGYTIEKLGFWGATPITRPTGWGAPTGTPTKTTFATSTVTTAQLAERVKALIDDLTTMGLIGA